MDAHAVQKDRSIIQIHVLIYHTDFMPLVYQSLCCEDIDEPEGFWFAIPPGTTDVLVHVERDMAYGLMSASKECTCQYLALPQQSVHDSEYWSTLKLTSQPELMKLVLAAGQDRSSLPQLPVKPAMSFPKL